MLIDHGISLLYMDVNGSRSLHVMFEACDGSILTDPHISCGSTYIMNILRGVQVLGTQLKVPGI